MKLLRLVSLVSSVVIGFSLSGCAGDTGTTPGTALNAYSHGQYWHANANDSVAKNAYSFAGFDVNFKEQEVTPGGDADKTCMVNGKTWYLVHCCVNVKCW